MSEARVVRKSDGEVYDGTWLFKHGSRNGGCFDFMIGNVAYLTGPPLHIHREQHDTFYVLDGTLAIQIGDDVMDLQPGDFATAPPGVPHTFDNVRKNQPPVKVCNLMTPGGLDKFLVSLNELGPSAHDSTLFAALGKMHGIEFVGPTIAQKLGLT